MCCRGWQSTLCQRLEQDYMMEWDYNAAYFKDRATYAYREAAADNNNKEASDPGGGKKDTLGEGLFEALPKKGAKELAGVALRHNLERKAEQMLKQPGA